MIKVLLELGRISNLPTIWTNSLAAVALVAGRTELGRADVSWAEFMLAGLSMSLMYTGGMFLNDALDRDIDAVHAPGRPIPSGRISARSVFVLAALQLALGWLVIAELSIARLGTAMSPATLAATLLVLVIVLYDKYHKENPLSPLVMALCRVGVYFSVGLLGLGAAHGAPFPAGGITRLALGASALLVYLMALTFLAKREWQGGKPPVPIHGLIAGICLLDATLMLASGAYIWALFAALGFWATLRLQRFVRGT